MKTPLELPEGIRYTACQFTSRTMKDVSRMHGRRVEVAEFGTPWWEASYTTHPLNREQRAIMDAWLINASSTDTTFLAYDVSRPRPIRHNTGQELSGTKAGGGAFDGMARLSRMIHSQRVHVTGLPAGFTLSPGDYVAFIKSPSAQSLHMITQTATADNSGRVELTFRHRLDRQHFTPGIPVRFEKPACIMQITNIPQNTKTATHTTVTFNAQEIFFS